MIIPQVLSRGSSVAASVPAGAGGLIFIPVLTGAVSPEWLPAAKGCFFGMTPSHGAGYFARALLEGCSFATRDVIDRLKQLGAIPVSSIAFSAGGSRSRLWAQIRADVAHLPISVASFPNTSVLGAAMLAGVAGKSFANLIEPMARLPRASERFYPNAKHHARLERAYAQYRKLFDALKPVFVNGV